MFPRRLSAEEWVAATDRISAELGCGLTELALRLGYASAVSLYQARRSGAPAHMTMALRAVAARLPRLPEEEMPVTHALGDRRRDRFRPAMR